MRIGFYSPLKPAGHAIPSGDRRMARQLIELFKAMGHEVEVICNLRTFDRKGDPARQRRLQALSMRAVKRVKRRMTPCDLIFTYHVFHKAPDWIGPQLADHWQVSYVIAEASIAGKQAGQGWDLGHRSAIAAIHRADHVLALAKRDVEGLVKHATTACRVSLLPPFTKLPKEPAPEKRGTTPTLLTIAMMRDDIKRVSYELLAASLQQLLHLEWRIDIVGDGEAADKVREVFLGLEDRVHWHGLLEPEQLAKLYRSADLFVWPGLNEAYGLVYLEAQSHGLPVVAAGEGGVPEIVIDGHTGLLSGNRDPARMAALIERLLCNERLRHAMGQEAARHIHDHHSFASAESHLRRVFHALNL